MRNILATTISLGLFLVVGFMAYMYYPENHFALQYQATADCQRQKDIHETAVLIERYFRLTGHYPLDTPSARREISMVLTEEVLPRQFKVNPPPEIRGELLPAAELKRALEQTLKEKIRLPADPQTAFAWGSRYYLYRLGSDGDYSLSATLFSRTDHTLERDRYRHNYQVGSKKSESEGMRRYIDIAGDVLECAAP
jgi:hypothetical protein